MRRKLRIILMVLSIPVLAWLLILALNWHSRLYRVTVLPKFRLRVVTPCAINDRGQIVGFCQGRFLLWTQDTGWRELGRASESLFINNAGQIAGTVDDPNGAPQTFLWDPNEGVRLLGTPGTGRSTACALNNRGQVVGQYGKDLNLSDVFVWDKAQGMRALDVVGGLPKAMNDAGQILGLRGSRQQGGELVQRFLWELDEDGSITGTLLPSAAFLGLNNSGYVLGRAFNFDERAFYAFIWRQDRGMEWVFALENQMARVVALNDANMVVVCEEERFGWLERLTGRRFGIDKESFVWTRERGRVFLDRYVLTRRGEHFDIQGLNNSGSIIGMVGREGRSEGRRSVLLKPIPERWGK